MKDEFPVLVDKLLSVSQQINACSDPARRESLVEEMLKLVKQGQDALQNMVEETRTKFPDSASSRSANEASRKGANRKRPDSD